MHDTIEEPYSQEPDFVLYLRRKCPIILKYSNLPFNKFIKEHLVKYAKYLHYQYTRRQQTAITNKDVDLFMDYLHVTAEEIEYIKNIPQRTEEWHFWRDGRITGSNFGKCAGHEKGVSRSQALKDMLWPEFKGSAATEYGTEHESLAFDIVEIALQDKYKSLGYTSVWIEDTGLLISKEEPFLAVSSDGLVHLVFEDGTHVIGTLEIKCPFRTKQVYPITPHKHFDQFMGAAALLKLPFAIYAVYTPDETQLKYYYYQSEYWVKDLHPKLHDFYHHPQTGYLFNRILKDRDVLKPGEIRGVPTVFR